MISLTCSDLPYMHAFIKGVKHFSLKTCDGDPSKYTRFRNSVVVVVRNVVIIGIVLYPITLNRFFKFKNTTR